MQVVLCLSTMDMGLEEEIGLPALLSPCAPLTVLLVIDVKTLHIVVKNIPERCLPSTHIRGYPTEQPQTPPAPNPDSSNGHFSRSRRTLLLSSITDSLRLEKTSETTESINPALAAVFTTKPCPQVPHPRAF